MLTFSLEPSGKIFGTETKIRCSAVSVSFQGRTLCYTVLDLGVPGTLSHFWSMTAT